MLTILFETLQSFIVNKKNFWIVFICEFTRRSKYANKYNSFKNHDIRDSFSFCRNFTNLHFFFLEGC